MFIDIIVDPTFFAPTVSEFWETCLMVDVDCHHNDRNHLEKKKNQGQTHQSGRKHCVRYRDAHEVSPYLTFFFSSKLITFCSSVLVANHFCFLV